MKSQMLKCFYCVKLSLIILMIFGWAFVVWKALSPIIQIQQIIDRYEQEEPPVDIGKVMGHQWNADDDEIGLISADGGGTGGINHQRIKLLEMKDSMLVMAISFISFFSVVTSLGLAGVLRERIGFCFLYGAFISMALIYTITQAVRNAPLWMEDLGKGFSSMLLLTVMNTLIWFYVRMLFWRRQQQHIIPLLYPEAMPPAGTGNGFIPQLN